MNFGKIISAFSKASRGFDDVARQSGRAIDDASNMNFGKVVNELEDSRNYVRGLSNYSSGINNNSELLLQDLVSQDNRIQDAANRFIKNQNNKVMGHNDYQNFTDDYSAFKKKFFNQGVSSPQKTDLQRNLGYHLDSKYHNDMVQRYQQNPNDPEVIKYFSEFDNIPF